MACLSDKKRGRAAKKEIKKMFNFPHYDRKHDKFIFLTVVSRGFNKIANFSRKAFQLSFHFHVIMLDKISFIFLFLHWTNEKKRVFKGNCREREGDGLKCDGRDWDFSIMISERNKIYEIFSIHNSLYFFYFFFENIIVADDKSATRDDDDVLQSTSSFIKFYL